MDFLGDRMKFKLAYVYVSLVILIVVILIFIVPTEKSNLNDLKNKSLMPNDSIHNILKNPSASSPSKENVSPEFKKQLEDLKAKSERNPKDVEILKEYADFLASAHQPDEALKVYERILKINPKHKEVLFTLAFIYYSRQDFAQAEIFTNKILAIDSEDHQALYNLGAINAAKGNKNKAKEIWENLIKHQPNTSSAELAKSSLMKLQ